MASIKDKKIYLSIGVVFVLIIGLHYLGWIKRLENAIQDVTIPFLGGMHGFSIELGTNYQFFKNRSDFVHAFEVAAIKSQKVDVLEAEVERLKAENDDLRKSLHYARNSTSTTILANVVGKEMVSADQMVIIDQGEKDGLKIDQPVITGEGVLVGKISKTYDNIAVVRLLNDNQSRIGAVTLNADKSAGVIEGGFGISLKMDMVPRDEKVLVGDKIISSGLEGGIPRGLFIGTVVQVENEPYKPFQQAIVSPGVDLSKLSTVSVITN